VPDGLGRLTHRQVVLEVLRTEAAGQSPLPTALNLQLGRTQVGLLAGLAVQLDQRGLDFRVPVDQRHGDDQVSHSPCDRKDAGVATTSMQSHRGLQEVPGAVQLVAVDQPAEAFLVRAPLHVAVEVTVGFLHALQEIREL
jgi:hypothetical protein